MTSSPTDEHVVPFTADDGMALNLIHVTGSRKSTRGPVLLVHGAGVRANIFRAPSGRTIVDDLLAEGWDVWLENWRASIDFPRNPWTLDQAAIFDHPAAVRAVLEHTKADEVRAIIHCQGSTSFAMSAVAGLLPDVSTIVSNAVSLHPVVNPLAHAKLRFVVPVAARAVGYLDPQWGRTGAPWVAPKAMLAWVRLTHHECKNTVCKLSSFTYGTGEPTLWRHENLNPATHDWLTDEFAHVPLTFFRQIRACVEAGALVSVEGRDELPARIDHEQPRTNARFTLVAGEQNACFTPESQRRTFAWLDAHQPGRHAFEVFPNYGHLDVFMGVNAHRDAFPTMLAALEK
jgi:hypothetical protein